MHLQKKYYTALKKILKSNPVDKIINTTLSQLIGTSVSEVVDEVTYILDYPGSSDKNIYANKSKDYYTKLASSGTFNQTKSYSSLQVVDDTSCPSNCVTTKNGCYCAIW